MGNILWIIIGGAIIGVLARLLLPGRQNVPWWAVIGVGIVGMFVGDFLAQLHLVTAGAFIAIIVPLCVFFALQRFFVRGLLAGSVKG